MPREARGGLRAIAGKRLTTLLSLYPYSFLLLSVSFNQSVVFPARLKAIDGKKLSSSSLCIASLDICHFSTEVDFSSEKYRTQELLVPTGKFTVKMLMIYINGISINKRWCSTNSFYSTCSGACWIQEGNAYQYRDPSQSKKYTIFSTERLQENKAVQSQVLYSGENSFTYHETRPVKRVRFDVEFPSFLQLKRIILVSNI